MTEQSRISVGVSVELNENSEYFHDSDYAGAGIVSRDDKSSLPYLITFPNGEELWVAAEDLTVIPSKYRVLLANNPMDGDGDVCGRNFLTDEPVDPQNIPRTIKGRLVTGGYVNVRGKLKGTSTRGTDATLGRDQYTRAFAMVAGMLVQLHDFKISTEATTKQLEIGKIYRLVNPQNSRFEAGTLVELIEQEGPEYVGLAYHVRKINTEITDWIRNTSVLELV